MINYYLLTKPGIIMGNLVTMFAGFLLASKGHLYPGVMLGTLVGLILIIASACVLNNIIDRDIDKRMNRTKNRPLAQGKISVPNAIGYALLLAVLGNIVLYGTTNLLTLFLADLGLFIYVFLYSLWKGDTIYGTAIGSLAGALPPVIGYTAVSNRIDLGAMILFFMLVLWQMPHFFSIAILHFEDYSRAEIPVLPIVKGVRRAKLHMILYVIGFIVAAALLTLYQYTGLFYLLSALALSLAWLAICFSGFFRDDDRKWAGRMFKHSLFVINAVCIGIFIDAYYLV